MTAESRRRLAERDIAAVLLGESLCAAYVRTRSIGEFCARLDALRRVDVATFIVPEHDGARLPPAQVGHHWPTRKNKVSAIAALARRLRRARAPKARAAPAC